MNQPTDILGHPIVTDEPRWFNSLGEEVDLDNIDREYAVAILAHLASRRRSADERLIRKLRDRAINGRDKNEADKRRGEEYNRANEAAGMPYRAR